MKRTILLAIATIWPLLYAIGFLGTILLVSLSPLQPQEEFFIRLFVVHFATFLFVIGLVIFYVCHVFKNQELTSEQKTLWTTVLLFAGIVAMPIYWYHYILRRQY